MIRLPRLLDSNMQEVARLWPERLSATINLTPLSTAEMVLPDGAPPVTVRQWVHLYGPHGSLGYFRVASVRTTYGNQQQVSMEHGIVTLEDATLPAELVEITGSMRSVLQTILDSQPVTMWQLGDVDVPDSESYTMETSADILLQAMLNAADMVSGYAYTFDQSTSPWTVHLKQLSNTVTSECRMSRNISGISISLDESDLVTRVTSPLLPGGYLDGPTVSRWGVISRPLDVEEDATQEEAVELAETVLQESQAPKISIEVDALELVLRTGETLDAFAVGSLCRAVLPDYDVIAKERIVTLYYADLLRAPEQVRLTLSASVRDVSNSLAGMRRTTSQLQSATSNNSRRITSAFGHITETENAVMIQAEQIALKAEKSVVEGLNSRLSQAEVDIDGANAAIALKASQTTVDEMGKRISSAEIAIDGANAEIGLKVSKDGLISAINMSPESIKISSGKIELDGQTIVSKLKGLYLDVSSIDSVEADFNSVWAVNGTFDNLTIGNYGISLASKYVCTGGKGVSAVGKTTINYLDHDGNKRSMLVVIDVDQYQLPTTELFYLGYDGD